MITEVQEWFESCIIRNYANPVAELQIMVSDNEQTKNQIIVAEQMGIDVEDYRYDESSYILYEQFRVRNMNCRLIMNLMEQES